MYKTILVSNNVEVGRRIVEGLEKWGWQITAAFWFYSEDDDHWDLYIISPDVSEKGARELYGTVSMLLYDLANDPKGPVQFPLDDIKIVSPYNLVYKTIRQRSALRLGPVPEGLVLDAYIYKMT